MADATRVLAGLDEAEGTAAVETVFDLKVSVRVARRDAACVRCGTFSGRVREYRTCRVRGGVSYECPTTLVMVKRRFGCDTPGCVGSVAESTGEVVPGRGVTARLCAAITRAAWDRLSLRTCIRCYKGGIW